MRDNSLGGRSQNQLGDTPSWRIPEDCSREIQDRIGQHLKRLYDASNNENLPDPFAALMAQLESAYSAKGRDE